MSADAEPNGDDFCDGGNDGGSAIPSDRTRSDVFQWIPPPSSPTDSSEESGDAHHSYNYVGSAFSGQTRNAGKTTQTQLINPAQLIS